MASGRISGAGRSVDNGRVVAVAALRKVNPPGVAEDVCPSEGEWVMGMPLEWAMTSVEVCVAEDAVHSAVGAAVTAPGVEVSVPAVLTASLDWTRTPGSARPLNVSPAVTGLETVVS